MQALEQKKKNKKNFNNKSYEKQNEIENKVKWSGQAC